MYRSSADPVDLGAQSDLIGASEPMRIEAVLAALHGGTVSVTYCDDPVPTAWDAVGRLVGRVPAVSLCNVCFPCARVWHPCR